MPFLKEILIPVLLILHAVCSACHGQFPVGERWYQNLLGFKPLKLLTSMGFIVSAVVTGTALMLTRKDSSLKQKLSLYTEVSATFGYKYPYTNIVQNSTGMNLLLRKWLSAGVELITTVPVDGYNKTVGFAIRPFARFYPLNKTHWKLWFESGGGLICFTDHFPKPTPAGQPYGYIPQWFNPIWNWRFRTPAQTYAADVWRTPPAYFQRQQKRRRPESLTGQQRSFCRMQLELIKQIK